MGEEALKRASSSSVRSPLPALRSPLPALGSPLSALRSPKPEARSPKPESPKPSHNGRMTRVCTAVLVTLLAVSVEGQAPAKAAADLAKLGPQVGERVPDFSLPDQDGRLRPLSSIMDSGGAMLVFFRSADW